MINLVTDLVFDCCSPLKHEMAQKFGFRCTYDYFKHNEKDAILFDELAKEGRKIATHDRNFMLNMLAESGECFFFDHKRHALWKIMGQAELIDPHFGQRYHDMITYHVLETDSILLP